MEDMEETLNCLLKLLPSCPWCYSFCTNKSTTVGRMFPAIEEWEWTRRMGRKYLQGEEK